jgi:RNA polymerase-binding transcription factor
MTNTARRRAHLERMLRDRRRELQGEVRHGIRHGRSELSKQGGDDVDRSDAHSQGDIDLALLQMRSETVRRIDAALVRLEAGTYGSCVECAKAISEPRLRALPFAARCQACEERREEEHGHARRIEQRRGSSTLFSDVVSS